ncbi:MAG TPA: segregation/condensation protein A [Oscillospiraceae bacterium]|nr:segregation/condensation protein A [Oscillospiraceae bacterium]HNW04702.1 segregation/condensation protein A [Oscillospiraceae bacterium]HPW00127.1 segregation/condensation protein A [Oscillospiraceae bacterium]
MPEKLQYKLEAFEGPLDLLLFLISKHKLNVYDINISELLGQYLESIGGVEGLNDLEDASEFLETAARLVYIKTAMLLPKYENEGEKLRQELQGELIEYAACKEAALVFKGMYHGGEIFCRAPEPIEIDMTYTRLHPKEDLARAYLSALGRQMRKLPPPPELFSPIVKRRVVSIASRAIILLHRLYRHSVMKLKELFFNGDKSERIAMFLAVLELSKNGRVIISDDCSTVTMGGRNKENRKEEEKLAAGTV